MSLYKLSSTVLLFLGIISFGYTAENLNHSNMQLKKTSGSADHLSLVIDFKKNTANDVLQNIQLPGNKLCQWILIPNGAQTSISVNKGIPIKKHIGNIDVSSIIIGKDIYAKLFPVQKSRGQDCAKLQISPFQYDDQSMELLFYPDLQVRIDFSVSTKPSASNFVNKNNTSILARAAINASDILDAQQHISTQGLHKSAASAGYDYLIISHDNFISAANTLADWKRSIGITTKVIPLSTIGSSPTPEQIESFIANEYASNSPAPSYLLLFGDHEYIPTFILNHSTTSSDYPQTPTDWKYADLEDDYLADFSFGRIPVNSSTTAMEVVKRIIAHEKLSPFLPQFKKVSLASPWEGDISENRRFIKTNEEIRNFLTDKQFAVDRIYHAAASKNPQTYYVQDVNIPQYYQPHYLFENDVSGTPLPSDLLRPNFQWNGSATDISNALNDGRFLFLYHGHGLPDMYAEPQFDNTDVDNLTNSHLPVVMSMTCLTGRFHTTECQAEHFIERANGGAVGVIANTNAAYSVGYSDRLIWGLMDAIWPGFITFNGGNFGESSNEPILRMGDVLNYGMLYMKTFFANDQSTYSNGDEFNIEIGEYFGDPTMEIIPRTTSAYGDVNNDHSITITDAMMIAQYSVGQPVQGFYPERADVNGDGSISIVDALLIAQHTVGLSSPDSDAQLTEILSAANVKKPAAAAVTFNNNNLTINYSLDKEMFISSTVFNLNGKKVSTLINSSRKAGNYKEIFKLNNYAPGVYIVKHSIGNSIMNQKFTIR